MGLFATNLVLIWLLIAIVSTITFDPVSSSVCDTIDADFSEILQLYEYSGHESHLTNNIAAIVKKIKCLDSRFNSLVLEVESMQRNRRSPHHPGIQRATSTRKHIHKRRPRRLRSSAMSDY